MTDGELLRVELGQLDANPFQPRKSMDSTALEELKAALRLEGLIQPIAVRPTAGGRFIIVAGHRRVEAFRQLLAETTTEPEKQRWATIAAVVKLAIDDAHLAAMAFMENVARAQLTPIEQARSIKQILDSGLAKTNEEVAALLAQPLRTVQRLLRIARAPRFIVDAVDAGVMVVAGQDAEGRERKELRRLDLMQALQFQTLFEHLQKTKPRAAEERAASAMRRALASNWGFRRTEEYVQGVLHGRPESIEREEGSGEGGVEGEAAEVFATTPRRFVVDLAKLRDANEGQRAALRAAFTALLANGATNG